MKNVAPMNDSNCSTSKPLNNSTSDGDAIRVGRVGALIEVGAGFQPMLTGRENSYVNGAILGMTKEDVDEKFDDKNK